MDKPLGRFVFGSDADAQRECERWQSILRLQDWTVKVKISTDVRGDDRDGEVEFSREHKTALIKLLDPVLRQNRPSIRNDGWMEQNHRRTLVHELLHLHTAPIVPSDLSGLASDAEEWMINALTAALVYLDSLSPESMYAQVNMQEVFLRE